MHEPLAADLALRFCMRQLSSESDEPSSASPLQPGSACGSSTEQPASLESQAVSSTASSRRASGTADSSADGNEAPFAGFEAAGGDSHAAAVAATSATQQAEEPKQPESGREAASSGAAEAAAETHESSCAGHAVAAQPVTSANESPLDAIFAEIKLADAAASRDRPSSPDALQVEAGAGSSSAPSPASPSPAGAETPPPITPRPEDGCQADDALLVSLLGPPPAGCRCFLAARFSLAGLAPLGCTSEELDDAPLPPNFVVLDLTSEAYAVRRPAAVALRLSLALLSCWRLWSPQWGPHVANASFLCGFSVVLQHNAALYSSGRACSLAALCNCTNNAAAGCQMPADQRPCYKSM